MATTMALDENMRDPMVLAILAEGGLDADRLPVTSSDAVQGREHETGPTEGSPRIYATSDLVAITWAREDGDVVLEIARLSNGFWLRSFTIESSMIPETARIGCVGRILSDVVAATNAETYRIVGYAAAGPMTRFFVETA